MTIIFKQMLPLFFCIYIVLAAYPITDSMTLGDVIMFILTSSVIFINKKLTICKELWFFLGYIVIQTFVLLFLSKPFIFFRASLVKLIHVIILYIIASCVSKYCDRQRFFKIYTYFSCICMVAIVFQFLQIWLFQVPKSILVPFSAYVAKDYELLTTSIRPTAFFLEPQHFASFIIPLLIIELRKRALMFSGLITFCIILSTSTQGIALVGVVWTLYFISYGKLSFMKKLVGFMIILSLITISVQTDLFIGAINKIESGTFDNNIRIFRAYQVFNDMPLSDKVSGIGIKNVNDYIGSTGVAKQWYLGFNSPARNFISSFFGNFVEFGVLGGILFLSMLFNMFRKSKFTGRCIVISLLVSSFVSTISYNVWFVFYFCIYRFVLDEKFLMFNSVGDNKWIKLVF